MIIESLQGLISSKNLALVYFRILETMISYFSHYLETFIISYINCKVKFYSIMFTGTNF